MAEIPAMMENLLNEVKFLRSKALKAIEEVFLSKFR